LETSFGTGKLTVLVALAPGQEAPVVEYANITPDVPKELLGGEVLVPDPLLWKRALRKKKTRDNP